MRRAFNVTARVLLAPLWKQQRETTLPPEIGHDSLDDAFVCKGLRFDCDFMYWPNRHALAAVNANVSL